jgi:diguanylate cyclase
MPERLFIVRSKLEAVRRTLLWSLIIAFVSVYATDAMYAHFFPDIRSAHGPALQIFAFALTMLIAAPILALFFRMSLRMNSFNARLKELARRDGLTGLLNRTALEDLIHQRTQGPRGEDVLEDALIIIDIDHFKSINDTHGHAAGDHVLRMVSVCIAGNVFERDHVARIGGEEFGVYLLNAGATGAVQAAERIRTALEEAKTHYEGEIIRVTASIGGALFPHGASYQTIYQGADFALYRAKRAGRNSCEFNSLPAVWHNRDQALPETPAKSETDAA